MQTLRCRFCGFQFSNSNGWRIFDAKSMPTRGAICWTYWYSALISQILTPKSYHRLGVIDIFSVAVEYFGTDGYFGCQICSKKYEFSYHSKNSPAQFVHTFAICSTALHSVPHILKTVPKIKSQNDHGSESFFIPKMAPPVGIGGHLDVSEISKISF